MKLNWGVIHARMQGRLVYGENFDMKIFTMTKRHASHSSLVYAGEPLMDKLISLVFF